jgi:hypothetical protein
MIIGMSQDLSPKLHEIGGTDAILSASQVITNGSGYRHHYCSAQLATVHEYSPSDNFHGDFRQSNFNRLGSLGEWLPAVIQSAKSMQFEL